MTYNEVINKLSMEMALALGDFYYLDTCKIYIQQALAIGIDHFTKDMEEVIAMDLLGREVGRYKSILDAERQLGVRECNIHQVLAGKNHTAGGYMFVRSKDKELIPAKKTA
jgi:hypothetical protein